MDEANKTLSNKRNHSDTDLSPNESIKKKISMATTKEDGAPSGTLTLLCSKMSYLKCQIIGANELLDQQEVAFSKHMHMAT